MILKRTPYDVARGDYIQARGQEDSEFAVITYSSPELATIMRDLLDGAIENHNEDQEDPSKCRGCGAEISSDTGLCHSCAAERALEEANEFRRGDD